MRWTLERTTDRAAGRKRALEQGFFLLLPVLWTLLLLNEWAGRDAVAFDFHNYYWPAGDRVLHGLSPYIHGPWYPSEVPVGFVYPAPTAVVFAGVAVIPRGVGDVVFTALALAAPLMTLRLLDVRDWRPYGLVLLWPPIGFGAQTANLSMLFAVAVAAMWRYRDNARAAGMIFGVVVAMKLFLAPLLIFFLATRRYAAAAYGVAMMVGFTGLAWLVVGLDELSRYRETLEEFTHLREDYGYSVIGFVDRVGGGRTVAYLIAMALAGSAVLACVILGRRKRESDAFILALSACLLATPILWLHYLVLLLIPIGLRCPDLRPLWALPLLLYGVAEVNPSSLQVVLALSGATVLVALALRTDDRWPVSTAVGSPSGRSTPRGITGS